MTPQTDSSRPRVSRSSWCPWLGLRSGRATLLLGLVALALWLTGCSVDISPPTTVSADGSAAGAGTASATVAAAAPDASAGSTAGSPSVRLLITRDFGGQVLLDTTAPHTEGMTVMSLLASAARVETGYGGGFVGAINGVASTFGKSGAAPPRDWFYWVDGVLGEVGAGDRMLATGETVCWDYHQWSGAAMIQSTLAAFPRPFSATPVQLLGPGSATALGAWLEEAGIRTTVAGEGVSADGLPGTGHAVATYTLDADLPTWVAEALGIGARGGVFLQVDDSKLTVLSEDGDVSEPAEAAALVVRNPSSPEALILLLLASDQATLTAFLQQLSPGDLPGHVGLYLSRGALKSLPAGATP